MQRLTLSEIREHYYWIAQSDHGPEFDHTTRRDRIVRAIAMAQCEHLDAAAYPILDDDAEQAAQIETGEELPW